VAEALVQLKDRALSATAEGITIADALQKDQPIIYANAAFERLTGYPPDFVIGRNCRFLQGPDTDPQTREAIRRAVRRGEPCSVEILNYRKDGTTFWNRLSITPVKDERGQVTHFIGVQSDVTARRRAEDSLRATRDELQRALRELEKDLDLAAQVQQSLLPAGLPAIEGFRAAWRFLPCTSLAGDSLNVLPLDDRRVGLYVLDVSGHGVAAALLSATLSRLMSTVPGQSCLFEPSPDAPGGFVLAPPAMVLRLLNDRHPREMSFTQYFTILYGVLDVDKRELVYAAAGQPGPLLVPRVGEPALQKSTGHPIGLLPDPAHGERRVQLQAGHRLFFFSDGLAETFGPKEEEFGRDRLAGALADSRSEDLERSLDGLLDQLKAWSGGAPFADDVSILGVELS
jgi:PAS domain S-box-containing protein